MCNVYIHTVMYYISSERLVSKVNANVSGSSLLTSSINSRNNHNKTDLGPIHSSESQSVTQRVMNVSFHSSLKAINAQDHSVILQAVPRSVTTPTQIISKTRADIIPNHSVIQSIQFHATNKTKYSNNPVRGIFNNSISTGPCGELTKISM